MNTVAAPVYYPSPNVSRPASQLTEEEQVLRKIDMGSSKGVLRRRGHTSYLSFLLHRQDLQIPNFTPKKPLKTPQNTKKIHESGKYMQFLRSIWKILHMTEYFYTGTARGARDNYEVCMKVAQKVRI